MAVSWTDSAVYTLLEALQSRESLWNTTVTEYKDKNKKKREYNELLELLKDDCPSVNLAALKGKIQSWRTSFREEVRKMKKSQSTGSGTNDIYVPKWKYEQCKFLEEVIFSSRATVSNISPSSCLNDLDSDDYDDDGVSKENNPQQTNKPVSPDIQHPTKKKRSVSWMETAANSLNDLAKGATNEPTDEWEIFGKDVASSIRSLGNVHLQRKAKFAVQQAPFQVSEPTPPFATQPLQYGHMDGQGSGIFNYQPLQSVHCRDY